MLSIDSAWETLSGLQQELSFGNPTPWLNLHFYLEFFFLGVIMYVVTRRMYSPKKKSSTLTEEEIGEYSGERKEVRPVTIATYQIITRRSKGEYRHLELFDSRDWGLIIYDEVHLLPAPVFRMTADLQCSFGRPSPDAVPAGALREHRVLGRPRRCRLAHAFIPVRVR